MQNEQSKGQIDQSECWRNPPQYLAEYAPEETNLLFFLSGNSQKIFDFNPYLKPLFHIASQETLKLFKKSFGG